MAMTKRDNDLLTLTGPGTPMGTLMRQYWTPAVRSSALEAGGAPVKVRLFCQDFVAFRTPDGQVGFVDEACPHRGVSLALARVEEGGLRCIFHGWQLDTTGKLVDAPAEPAARRESFCNSVRLNRYQARESAGIVWVFLAQTEAPPFPDFEFMGLRPEQLCIRRAVVPYNWLQGLEAHLDSSHVPFLHAGSLQKGAGHTEERQREALSRMTVDKAPRFEMEETPYGLREGALRDMGDGNTYARIREAVLPFFTFIPGPPDGQCSGRISVPIDDGSCAEWYVVYDPRHDLSPSVSGAMFFNTSPDPDNFAANMGTADDMWGQDREAMKNGHFSGLTRNLSFEDFIVQASMGPRFDRSTERLGAADVIIVKARRMLLEALHDLEGGKPARWVDGFDYRTIRARSVTFEKTADWRDYAWPVVREREQAGIKAPVEQAMAAAK
jgi:phenylpropionate dioxygenase-like ring-hydroxylating dioxygenase large terminal subunit